MRYENQRGLSKFELEKAIHDLTRLLFSQKNISAEELQNFLADRLDFMPRVEVDEQNQFLTVAQIQGLTKVLYKVMNEINLKVRQILPKKNYFDEKCQISQADVDALREKEYQVSIAIYPSNTTLPDPFDKVSLSSYVSGDTYVSIYTAGIPGDANNYWVPQCKNYQIRLDTQQLVMEHLPVR